MKKTLLALLLTVLPSLLFAADQKFTFALPDLDGRISLGVFNERGKLVRTLYVGATTADFTIGLNGLIATWDGKSDIGVVMPSGKYFVRGFVVGDAVKAEGEAYHFNDWIEDEKSPRITQVEDFQKVERGFVLLASGTGGPCIVARYDMEKGFLWQKFLDFTDASAGKGNLNRIAVGDSTIVTLSRGSLQAFNLETGEAVAAAKAPAISGVSAIYAQGKYFSAATGDSILNFALPDLESRGTEKPPVPFSAMIGTNEFRIGAASEQPGVWIGMEISFNKIDVKAEAKSLSFGGVDDFWLAGTEEKGGGAFVGQFNLKGELLRAYRSDFVPQEVRASEKSEEISVLEKKDATQRLRQMDLVARPGGGSEWEISFEKVVTPCGKFGVVNGDLVADAGGAPQRTSIEFPLATGGLTAAAPKLTVQLASDGTGLWLETASKLKLVRLADQLYADRFVLVPGENKASMTAYAGDGVVVAEYSITGLDAIAEIDAGEIEIP